VPPGLGPLVPSLEQQSNVPRVGHCQKEIRGGRRVRSYVGVDEAVRGAQEALFDHPCRGLVLRCAVSRAAAQSAAGTPPPKIANGDLHDHEGVADHRVERFCPAVLRYCYLRSANRIMSAQRRRERGPPRLLQASLMCQRVVLPWRGPPFGQVRRSVSHQSLQERLA
jgi:hypothetical protein